MATYEHYALCDPRETVGLKAIRYIGRTTWTLERRLLTHWYQRNKDDSYRSRWLKSLARDGIRPTILSLGRGGESYESVLISRYRMFGCALVNGTSGGEGGCKVAAHVREHLSEVNTGKKASEETKAKLRAAWTRRTVPPDVRARITATNTGKKREGQALENLQAGFQKRSFRLREGHPAYRQVKELRAQGLTYREIADRLGISKGRCTLMALHERPETAPIPCTHCGTIFVPAMSHSHFCQTSCRIAYHSNILKEKKRGR